VNDLTPIKAPFPYFGGKLKVAADVWAALGDVANYVEPFAGSLAVLLSRPHAPKIETVNDFDCMISNFWRAVAMDPDAVAHHADWPVNEADLEARHYWLVCQKDSLRDRLGDPAVYDARIAGWWLWGCCAWIGAGWCAGNGPWWHDGEKWQKRDDAGRGIIRQRPHLGDAGVGINRQGVAIRDYMQQIANRLRNTRVCCGDWSRVCGPTPTFKHGLTGVFLDPPYSLEGRAELYNHETDVFRDVTIWALENGSNPLMRIVVAGYAGEHDDLADAGWRVERWKARGGYGTQGEGQGRANAWRETLWFSPHCLKPEQGRLL
jgi:DNA adenine methylase